MIQSRLTWVDLTAADVRAANEFIASCSDEGQRDELGFIPLQSVLADRFYPATTTQMTLARHFYFLPSIYELAEGRRLSGPSTRDEVARIQRNLRKVLEKNGGPRVRALDPKVLPSAQYWSSLQDLGFFAGDGSERDYTDGLSTKRPEADDDGDVCEGGRRYHWDRRRPKSAFLSAKGEIGIRTGPGLTRLEANDLLERFRRLPDDLPDPGKDQPNMLCHMVSLGQWDFPNVWDVPRPPRHLQEAIRHARLLSLFARGTRLQYESLLLSRRQEKRRRAAETAMLHGRREEFLRWVTAAREGGLGNWNVDHFVEIAGVDAQAGGVGDGQPVSESFFARWLSHFRRRRSAAELLDDADTLAVIETRERDCKRSRARLSNPEELMAWDPRESSGDRDFALDYRHRVGKQFAESILAAISRDP